MISVRTRALLGLAWRLLLAGGLTPLTSCFEDDETCPLDPVAVPTLDNDGDGYPASDDCDDQDFDTNPAARETCDGLDNNCDGSTDGPESEDAQTWYTDADGDGYGDDDSAETSCAELASHALIGGDCDDQDAAFYPGAPEDDCTDLNDYNCDGSVSAEDADADGYVACQDCDDSDPLSNPGATEIWYDGVDEDCASDDDYDQDADGYDTDSFGGPDCVDTDASIYPGAGETPDDGIDQDCDGGDATTHDTGGGSDDSDGGSDTDTVSDDSAAEDDSGDGATAGAKDAGCSGCASTHGADSRLGLLLGLLALRRRRA